MDQIQYLEKSKSIFIIQTEMHFFSAVSLIKNISPSKYSNVYVLVNKCHIKTPEVIDNFFKDNNITCSIYSFDYFKNLHGVKKFVVKQLYQFIKLFSKKIAFHFFYKIPFSFLNEDINVFCAFPTAGGHRKLMDFYKPRIVFELYDGLLSVFYNYKYPKYVQQFFVVRHNKSLVKHNFDIYANFVEVSFFLNMCNIYKLTKQDIDDFIAESNIISGDKVLFFLDQPRLRERSNIDAEEFLKNLQNWIGNKKSIKLFVKGHPRDSQELQDKYPFLKKQSTTLPNYFKFLPPIEILVYLIKKVTEDKLKIYLISGFSSANFFVEDLGILDDHLISIICKSIASNKEKKSLESENLKAYQKVHMISKFEDLIRLIEKN